jgi:hypothetical protein
LLPCRNVRRNNEPPRHSACNQLPTPPGRREQAPARSPHPKCGMVLMGAHRCNADSRCTDWMRRPRPGHRGIVLLEAASCGCRSSVRRMGRRRVR